MQQIPYSEIPGQLPIFLDAIESFQKVSRFYNGDFRDADSYRKVWDDLQSYSFHREEVSGILVKEQERLGAPGEAIENAKPVADPKAAAVLTGQQIGLIGGPLYTVIKAVAAIRWADYLSDVIDAPVVPIFWMEGEDHDFEEIRRVTVLDRDGGKVPVGLEDRRAYPHQVVGWHRPGAEMNRFLKELDNALPPGMHRDEVIHRVRDCYQPGVSLSDAFGRWLLGWLGDRGLVVAESLNPDLKRLAAPCFQRAVSHSETHVRLYEERRHELEVAGYPCTLKPSAAFHFFYVLNDGVRVPVSRGDSPEMFEGDLADLAVEHPERFSPKAILRPVVQDMLFPTVAIIAGPGEMSYFPQVQPFYVDYGRPMPVIVPRPGITLLEKAWERNLGKLSLSVTDLYLPQELLNRKIAGRGQTEVMEGIDKRIQAVNASLDEIESLVSDVDTALLTSAQKLRGAIERRLQQFVSRIENGIVSSDQAMGERIQRLRTALYPDEHLQERVYSPLSFLIRHGFEWVADRLGSVPMDRYNHFVVPLEE
ncbi:hypothetical protein AMJ86_05030 [bacterium SM23_57]|nr:MAG: hypothetical protein AMJ86_05030 [bacterium SM23_57]